MIITYIEHTTLQGNNVCEIISNYCLNNVYLELSVEIIRFIVVHGGEFQNVSNEWIWPGSKTTSVEVRRGITYRDVVDILKARLRVDRVYNLNLKFKVLSVNLLSLCQPTG